MRRSSSPSDRSRVRAGQTFRVGTTFRIVVRVDPPYEPEEQ